MGAKNKKKANAKDNATDGLKKKKLSRHHYETELASLQTELVKLQTWVKHSGARIVVVFEGRDAAGKGGTIKRFTEHLNPRQARVVALNKPTWEEKGQWFFQRYINHLPTVGEDVRLLDRLLGSHSPNEGGLRGGSYHYSLSATGYSYKDARGVMCRAWPDCTDVLVGRPS